MRFVSADALSERLDTSLSFFLTLALTCFRWVNLLFWPLTPDFSILTSWLYFCSLSSFLPAS